MLTRLHLFLTAGLLFALACGEGLALSDIEDQEVAVGQEVSLLVAVKHAVGRVAYDYSTASGGMRARAELTSLPIGAARFRWVPLATDVGLWDVVFTAKQGDMSARTTVRLDVRSASGSTGAPRFVRPLGGGIHWDPATEHTLSVSILVSDPDTEWVEVRRGPADDVVGDVFVEAGGTGGKVTTWRWSPGTAAREQLSQDADHRLITFLADDGEHPPTRLPFLVVFGEPHE